MGRNPTVHPVTGEPCAIITGKDGVPYYVYFIKCPGCGKDILETTAKCPFCGRVINSAKSGSVKKSSSVPVGKIAKIGVAAAAVILIVGIGGSMLGGFLSGLATEPGKAPDPAPTPAPEVVQPADPAPVPEPEPVVGDLGPSTIEEAVVMDWNGIKVTAKGIDHEELFGPEVDLLIENNSNDDIILQSENAIVNSYIIMNSLSKNVAAGKKANAGMTLMSSTLDDANIGKFEEISFDLQVVDPNTYQRIYDAGTVTLQTNYYGSNLQKYDDSGIEIYNNNSLRVVAKEIRDDEVFGPEIMLYVENLGDKSVVVQTDDFSANGFMVTDSFSKTILPKTRYVGGITLFESSLEENEIVLVEDVEFVLKIIDPETWETIETTEPISLTFEP